jgi:hypothetical protein
MPSQVDPPERTIAGPPLIKRCGHQKQKNRHEQLEELQQSMTIAKWEAVSPRTVAVRSSSSFVSSLNMSNLLVVIPANVAAHR